VNGAALALGFSSLAFAVFALVRPYPRFDPRVPAETVARAAPAIASTAWLLAHYLLLVGFVLLLCALPALHARLSAAGVEVRSRRAMVLSGIGVTLILPTLGLELYVLPEIGRLYLDGQRNVAELVGLYRGAALLVMLLGLLLLAIGAALFARAVGKSGALPRWAAVTYAVGLAFWCPLLPPPVRVVDGLLIGIGGVALAWALRAPGPSGRSAQ
jgi:hypothetical protein